MKTLITVIAISFCLFIIGCTEKERARSFGGVVTEKLPVGQKLVVVTWKEGNLWTLTRKMKETETPETYEFTESSAYGVMQGKVIITESKF